MLTQAQKQKALELYAQLKSVTAVINKLDYLSKSALYRWINQENVVAKKERAILLYENMAKHPLHPSAQTKLEILRHCFEVVSLKVCINYF